MKGISNSPNIPPPARELTQVWNYLPEPIVTRDLGNGVFETTVRIGDSVRVFKYDVYADCWLDEPASKPDFLWEGQRD